MPTIRATENEFRSQVTSWLNKYIEQGGYPFERASEDPSVSSESKIRFPDIQLWINREAEEGFCGLELKPPSVKADDKDLIENAVEKAKRMNAQYFVTWNMRDAIIWQLVNEGSKKVQRLFSYPSLTKITAVDNLKIPSVRIMLEEQTQKILNDLAQLSREGHLTFLGADDWFFIHRLTDTSQKIQPFYKERLFELTAQDPTFRERLHEWAVKQGFVIGDSETFLDTIAHQIVYQLLGRLLFLEVLRRFRSEISPLKLDNLSEAQAHKEFKRKFAEIRSIDYQAIFEEDLTDEILVPKEALPHIANLISEFGRRDFASLPQEVLGSVFENLILPTERHRLGQYFTKEDLVDFITAFCVRRQDDAVLDPTCGTGTFLVRAYDRFKWYFQVRNHQKLLGQLWGIDIAPFPAELATINLYRQDISNIANFPRILKKDFFEVKEGQKYEFPPNKLNIDDPTKKIKEQFPAFDAVVGNPPYIRQEQIDKVDKTYKQKIGKALVNDYKVLGHLNVMGTGKHLSKETEQIEISGQADIYAFMFVHAGALLKEGGRLGFVTSNSWLGAEYGKEMQRFFLRHFKIVAIVESRVEPWFETAQVNTIFTILERCENEQERKNHLVKFVSLKKKLSELMPHDMRLDAHNRWHNLANLITLIESVGSQHIKINLDGTIKVEPPKLINDLEDSNLRVRYVKQGSLSDEVPKLFGEGHWGRFLRAPQIYFELRQILKDKLVPLSDESIINLSYGLKPGITEFFNVTEERAKEFGIEKEFLVPFVTSFREVGDPIIDTEKTKYKLFLCHLDKNELRRLGKKGALKYIEWGEKQTTSGRGAVGKKGVRWPEVPSVKNRKLWYDVGVRESSDVLFNQFVGERVFFPVNQNKSLASNTFFEVNFLDGLLGDLWTALMNSTLFYLLVYVHGRVDWSQGPLRLYGPEISSLLLPDARQVSDSYKAKILKAFDKILKRPIKRISEEVKQKDRKEFDSLVLEALGIGSKEILKKIYAGLVDLVETRLRLGKMQSVEKRAKKVKDVPKIKEEVKRDVLADGLLPFPENFVTPRTGYRDIVVPTARLKLGEYFLGKQELITERGETQQLSSVADAEFILFAQKPNSHIVRIPKKAVEVEHAVNEYKKYLKKIRQKLVREFVMRTGDESLSERLSAEVLEELGVLV